MRCWCLFYLVVEEFEVLLLLVVVIMLMCDEDRVLFCEELEFRKVEVGFKFVVMI